MKRTKVIALIACMMLVLAACGGGTDAGSNDDHAHTEGESDDHAHDGATFGEPGDPADADETIEIVAQDAPFRFEPEEIEVSAGDTIIFELVNEGEVQHELALLAEPTEEATSGHEHSADPNATPRVDPGGREQVVWTFGEPGEYVYECHVDGHHLTGMRGKITVSG